MLSQSVTRLRGLELADLGGEPTCLLAQLKDLSDSSEIRAIGEKAGDVGDSVQVVAAVPTGPTPGADWGERTRCS